MRPRSQINPFMYPLIISWFFHIYLRNVLRFLFQDCTLICRFTLVRLFSWLSEHLIVCAMRSHCEWSEIFVTGLCGLCPRRSWLFGYNGPLTCYIPCIVCVTCYIPCIVCVSLSRRGRYRKCSLILPKLLLHRLILWKPKFVAGLLTNARSGFIDATVSSAFVSYSHMDSPTLHSKQTDNKFYVEDFVC
jgi:hypothetical protein